MLTSTRMARTPRAMLKPYTSGCWNKVYSLDTRCGDWALSNDLMIEPCLPWARLYVWSDRTVNRYQ